MSHDFVPRVRLSPELRRQQLIDVGISLLSEMSLTRVTPETLAERAGVSRGLLYHYFGGAEEVQVAIVHQLAADLVAKTAPIEHPDPMVRLRNSISVFLAYLEDNAAAYEAIRRGAAVGSGELHEIYERSRRALIERIFEPGALAGFIPDNPLARRLALAWSSFVEELLLAWVRDPEGVTRERIIEVATDALPAVMTPAMAMASH